MHVQTSFCGKHSTFIETYIPNPSTFYRPFSRRINRANSNTCAFCPALISTNISDISLSISLVIPLPSCGNGVSCSRQSTGCFSSLLPSGIRFRTRTSPSFLRSSVPLQPLLLLLLLCCSDFSVLLLLLWIYISDNKLDVVDESDIVAKNGEEKQKSPTKRQ